MCAKNQSCTSRTTATNSASMRTVHCTKLCMSKTTQLREHRCRVGAHAAPQMKALRRLLYQHAQSVRVSACAAFLRPTAEAGVGFAVGELVGERARTQLHRRQGQSFFLGEAGAGGPDHQVAHPLLE